MKTSVRIVNSQRKFTLDFKRQLVKEFESGTFSVKQLGKLYSIRPQVIYNWIYKFSTFNEKGTRIIEMKESSSAKLIEMEQRIKELEQALGQKQIKIDYLEKMIDLAKSELDIDIKKNYNTPQSTGSEKTDK